MSEKEREREEKREIKTQKAETEIEHRKFFQQALTLCACRGQGGRYAHPNSCALVLKHHRRKRSKAMTEQNIRNTLKDPLFKLLTGRLTTSKKRTLTSKIYIYNIKTSIATQKKRQRQRDKDRELLFELSSAPYRLKVITTAPLRHQPCNSLHLSQAVLCLQSAHL